MQQTMPDGSEAGQNPAMVGTTTTPAKLSPLLVGRADQSSTDQEKHSTTPAEGLKPPVNTG